MPNALLAWPLSCSLYLPAIDVEQSLNEGAMRILQGTCRAALLAAALVGAAATSSAQTQGTIKIGVLHSLSGTMAISETTLKDTILMMVDDVNKRGGLLGKKI